MGEFRYPQFCALARATEIVGERWTLLIVRDLSLGPLRFSALRRRLSGVSSSVVSERLTQLERRGLLEQRMLQPPAASTVYALTQMGRALQPVLVELMRWGTRFMLP
ncbi:MAG: helix-turn-helix domain-containing protein, partial [Deltaproteobacteria bacterium]|nr:helix-turn-helix domain-containing protein [Deltaproteobacteria bacterium]